MQGFGLTLVRGRAAHIAEYLEAKLMLPPGTKVDVLLAAYKVIDAQKPCSPRRPSYRSALTPPRPLCRGAARVPRPLRAAAHCRSCPAHDSLCLCCRSPAVTAYCAPLPFACPPRRP